MEIVGLGVQLIYSPEVEAEFETTIGQNLDRPLTTVALFISRLLKGLQDLSNATDFRFSWGRYYYLIEDVGEVSFYPVQDMETGEKAFMIESIDWRFETSRFFSEFSR